MMKSNNNQKLEVHFNHLGEKVKIGTLISESNRIYFKYEDEFVQSNASLSPFKLAWNSEIQEGPEAPFEGLFGLFSDSLPDAWGRLLLDRFLQSSGRQLKETTLMDRLAFVGKKGAGALEYIPIREIDFEGNKSFLDLQTYADSAIEVLDKGDSNLLSDFYSLAGTSGGARPKIELAYNKSNDTFKIEKEDLSDGFAPWIVKFPSRFDVPDIAQIEFTYYKMAQEAGVIMNESKLFPSQRKGVFFFGTKRFDRQNRQKIHKQSASGLLHDDFQNSNIDYGHLMDATIELTKSRQSLEQVFRLAAFNVFTCNQDDHSKNFSFIMDEKLNWKFAPAYDLTFSPSTYNFHSTTIGGVSQNVNSTHLLALANHFDLSNAKQIIKEVKEVVSHWVDFADQNKVSALSKKRVFDKLQSIE